MMTHFLTHQIPGKGRGKFLGYPTINMVPPVDLDIENGIYASWITIDGIRFRGALHWGPIPTFDESTKSLEVFLLGLDDQDLSKSDLSHITVEIVEKLRDVLKFVSINELTKQIEQDVRRVRSILRE